MLDDHDRAGSHDARDARRRALRREILEIRTVTISLRSAMHDLGADRTVSGRERIALRRAWCAQASALLAQVEARWRAAAALRGTNADDAGSETVERLIDTARQDVEQFRIRIVA